MVKIKTEIPQELDTTNTFRARVNVNTCIPVNIYEGVRKYNKEYLARLKAINGDNVSIPDKMNYRIINRGDILTFADKEVVNEDTGHVTVFPKEVFDEMFRHTVELPCLLFGPVEQTYEKIKAMASPKMRKEIEKHVGDTARFRTVPFLEKYTGNEADLED